MYRLTIQSCLVTITSDVVAELLSSPSFLSWSPDQKPSRPPAFGSSEPFVYKGEKYTNLVVDEKHVTCSELAAAWGVSPQTIREVFRKEEGVLKIGSEGTRTRRAYRTLRIPESVAVRVHTRLAA